MIREDYAKKFCCEDISLIENYNEAKESDKMWHCHHRREISDGKIISKGELISLNLYYHRPASELIFLESTEHRRLHNVNKILSEETRKKISQSRKGKEAWNKGKKLQPLSEKHKQKISETEKGRICYIKGKHKVWDDKIKNKYHFE